MTAHITPSAVEAMAFRTTTCDTCGGSGRTGPRDYYDLGNECADCSGEGSWDTPCETCGEVRALSEGNHCANCLGLTETHGDPFGRRFAA